MSWELVEHRDPVQRPEAQRRRDVRQEVLREALVDSLLDFVHVAHVVTEVIEARR